MIYQLLNALLDNHIQMNVLTNNAGMVTYL